MKGFHYYWLVFISVSVLFGCENKSHSVLLSTEFDTPQRVTILNYDDHAMEPSISRDGNYLFFNNSNDPGVNTNLHWAERIDDLTFDYMGELEGINTPALEGVASMDASNTFYFVSTRSYDQTLSTVYRGIFNNGTVSDIELVTGISGLIPGDVNFDAEISPDGNTLYYVDSQFGSSGPETADIMIATLISGEFERLSASDTIMQQINTDDLEYAPAISASGLKIFFTRFDGTTPAIYTASRPDESAPFETPLRISAIVGFAEAPALSPNENSIYYHLKEDDVFVIYRVTRQINQ